MDFSGLALANIAADSLEGLICRDSTVSPTIYDYVIAINGMAHLSNLLSANAGTHAYVSLARILVERSFFEGNGALFSSEFFMRPAESKQHDVAERFVARLMSLGENLPTAEHLAEFFVEMDQLILEKNDPVVFAILKTERVGSLSATAISFLLRSTLKFRDSVEWLEFRDRAKSQLEFRGEDVRRILRGLV